MSRLSSGELRRRIDQAESELQNLRAQLVEAEAKEENEKESGAPKRQPACQDHNSHSNDGRWKWPLFANEYERYARQLILPGVGLKGQLRLKAASVLIVGAGGLGCPAAAYLAGAGVGHIGVVDGDVVEASNLHRQIGHSTDRVGMHKAESLVTFMRQLNPLPRYTAHVEALTPSNAARLICASEEADGGEASYDLVLDCTDHPAVRYLISDACVRAGKPLVSAAALRTDGQLVVLNWPVGQGPCYRCLFPRPPPAASQVSCAEGGVLGPVVGTMGMLQALEAIRIIVAGVRQNDAKTESDMGQRRSPMHLPTLLLFSTGGGSGTLSPPSFRSVRLRGRRSDCFACSPNAPLQQLRSLEDVGSTGGNEAWPDYAQFCGVNDLTNGVHLQPNERISVADYDRLKEADRRKHWILDVREKEFYELGSLEGAINVPFSRIQAATVNSRAQNHADGDKPPPAWLPEGLAEDTAPVYLVCRVGNDSQVVTRQLKELGLDKDGTRFIGDIKGGILAWKKEIDNTIPFV